MKINVIKQNLEGQETWRYAGKVLRRGDDFILLEARFNYPQEVDLSGLVLRSGDRFVEIFYSDRWYNIFEIHDREDDQFKGWYCNISTPAVIDGNVISYRDLALDLLVFPDGRQKILDEDEFNKLPLSPKEHAEMNSAMTRLQMLFRDGYKRG